MLAAMSSASDSRQVFDRRTRWAFAALGLSVAIACGLVHAIQAKQITSVSPEYAAIVTKVKALPVPLSKRLVWISYGESAAVESAHAVRQSADVLHFVGICNVVLHPMPLHGSQLFRGAGITLEQETMLWTLHEKGHCVTDANSRGLRANLPEPAAANLESGATPQLVKTLAEESFADVYAYLWMAKLYPQQARDFYRELVGFRESELKDSTNGYLTAHSIAFLKAHHMRFQFGVDDHYTVPALEAVKAELGEEPARKLANMTAEDIQKVANRVPLESSRQYARALGNR